MDTKAAAPAYARGDTTDSSVWFAGSRFTFYAEGHDTGGTYAFFDNFIPAGAEPGPHSHEHEDEGFLILGGSCTFVIDGVVYPAPSGTFIWAPRGTEHSFTIDSDSAHLLTILTPAGNEQAVRQLGVPATAPGLPPTDVTEANIVMNTNRDDAHPNLDFVDDNYGVHFTNGDTT
jgi:quercetin dioxygenase-like cupin family protein